MPKPRSTLEHEAALFYSDAWHDHVDNQGHDLEPGWHDAVQASWIAQCRSCGAWLCSDLESADPQRGKGEATPYLYGSVLGQPCAGAPPERVAPRRDEMDFEAAAAFFTPKELSPPDPQVRQGRKTKSQGLVRWG